MCIDPLPFEQFRARARAILFTVVFYGLEIFCCKIAQVSETPRELVCQPLPLKNRLRKIAKTCAKSPEAIRASVPYLPEPLVRHPCITSAILCTRSFYTR